MLFFAIKFPRLLQISPNSIEELPKDGLSAILDRIFF
jgi:hypothetical protein